MNYFLTVKANSGIHLHRRQRFETFEAALEFAAARYLTDHDHPFRWIGCFYTREGRIARLYIPRATGGLWMRPDINPIDIMSERGLLEAHTWGESPVN